MLENLNNIQKAIVAACSIFILITIYQVARGSLSVVQQKFGGGPPYLVIRGENGRHGVYDPSLAYDKENNKSFMVYSSIITEKDNRIITQFTKKNPYDGISINLAVSEDSGTTWNKENVVFQTKSGEVISEKQTQEIFARGTKGMWRYEQPTIIHTPKDIGKEWKVYAYKYFWDDNFKNARNQGIIVYKYASNPLGEWSDEIRLFGANNKYPLKPYNDNVAIKLNKLSKDLNGINFYSDPSAVYAGGIIFMSLTGYVDGLTPEKTILISSTNYGKSWSYMGTILDRNDAQYFGNDSSLLSNSTLIMQNNKLYLSIVYGDWQVKGKGFAIMAFSDLIKGQIKRDDGEPEIIIDQPAFENFLSFPGISKIAYNENLQDLGVLMPQVNRESGTVFRIYNTKISSIPVKD